MSRLSQRHAIAGLCIGLLLMMSMLKPGHAAPQDEIRAAFENFVAAQNDHDVSKAKALLLASPDFLWITRGAPIWGSDAALNRFATLYKGTWRLDPDMASLRIMLVGDGAARLYVPITFTIAAAGQPPPIIRFLMNQLLVRTARGWQVASILPIPAAKP